MVESPSPLRVASDIGGAAGLGGLLVTGILYYLSLPFAAVLAGGCLSLGALCVGILGHVFFSNNIAFNTIGEWRRDYTFPKRTGQLHQDADKPVIEYAIKDALIVPHGDQANCFVKLAVQNTTDVRCQNPQDYKIVLRVKGEDIKRAVPLDLQEFELAYYKYVEKYTSGEYPDRYEEAQELRREALVSLLENKGILVKGEITEGWLGFSVYYINKWNQDAEYMGTRTGYRHYSEDGEPDEDSVYPVEEYHYTPNTTAIESLKLTVTDAYFQIRTIETNGPFEDNHRNIVKAGSSPASRQIMPWRML